MYNLSTFFLTNAGIKIGDLTWLTQINIVRLEKYKLHVEMKLIHPYRIILLL